MVMGREERGGGNTCEHSRSEVEQEELDIAKQTRLALPKPRG